MIPYVIAAGVGAAIGTLISVIFKKGKKMYDCHKDIIDYHDDRVTLSQKVRTKMKDRRDSNRKRINKNLSEDDPKPIGFQTQGSYAMLTMVMDAEDDYDIDDGIYFEKSDLFGPRGGELSPRQIKQIVCDAAHNDSFKKPPEVRTNCVRVFYNDGPHVDIPVYRKIVEEDFWGNETVTYEIAGAEWKESDPQSVTKWFREINKDLSPDKSNGRQFRRIVRSLKKFSKSRDSWKSKIASGFIITKLASECYEAIEDREDTALYDTMKAIYDRLVDDLEVSHPTLSEKLTSGADDAKTKFLRERLKEQLDNLDVAIEDDCDHASALEAWGKVFKSNFFFDRAKDKRDKEKKAMADTLSKTSQRDRSNMALAAVALVKEDPMEYRPWTSMKPLKT